MIKNRYVLITAARNEQDYIKETLESITSQTIKPVKWIIVSDGSTDNTNSIIESFITNNKFIQLLKNPGDKSRNFGSQVKAINAGYELLKKEKYDYIGNVDADISFENNYFENIISKFEINQNLGLAGGWIVEKENGKFVDRNLNNVNAIPHAVQLFKKECFDLLGGYIHLKYGGPDTWAEITTRMNGYEVHAFEEYKVKHLKPALFSEGFINGGIRQGLMDNSLGYIFIFEIFKCAKRLFRQKPFILYSFFRFLGYLLGKIKNESTPVSKEFLVFFQNEQKKRLLRKVR